MLNNSSLLRVHNVMTFIYQQPLFEPVNLFLAEGEILHVTGDNGCGKSTLLRIILGLTTCEQGEIIWRNTVINRNADFKNDCCYLGHKDALKMMLTAAETVTLYQTLIHHKKGDIDSVLLYLGLLEQADTLVKHLSFGQKRRLALSRFLLSTAKLWVLDEPYSGVDAKGRALLNDLCLKHTQSGGMVILTHHGELGSQFDQSIKYLAL